jgi:hypothetical protein
MTAEAVAPATPRPLAGNSSILPAPHQPQTSSSLATSSQTSTHTTATARASVSSLTMAATWRYTRSFGGPSEQALVREHQLEIFAQHFPIWMALFALLNCLTAIVTIALFLWVVVSYASEIQCSCDVPLRLWSIVEFVSGAYGLVQVLNKILYRSWSPILHMVLESPCVQRHLDDRRLFPCWARVYSLITSMFDFAWMSLGLYWLLVSKTCHSTSPNLFKSVRAYIFVTLPCFAVIFINAWGLHEMMSVMMRYGILTSKDAAPPDTLSKLRVVVFDENDPLFQDHAECSICLGAFTKGSSAEEIRVTRCGHMFHSKCLGNWLRVKRACPLCRQDLVDDSHQEMDGSSAPASPVQAWA